MGHIGLLHDRDSPNRNLPIREPNFSLLSVTEKWLPDQLRADLATLRSAIRGVRIEASSTRFLPFSLARYKAWSAAWITLSG